MDAAQPCNGRRAAFAGHGRHSWESGVSSWGGAALEGRGIVPKNRGNLVTEATSNLLLKSLKDKPPSPYPHPNKQIVLCCPKLTCVAVIRSDCWKKWNHKNWACSGLRVPVRGKSEQFERTWERGSPYNVLVDVKYTFAAAADVVVVVVVVVSHSMRNYFCFRLTFVEPCANM